MKAPPDLAILDGASFVLPYDLQRIRALAAGGRRVAFYGSETAYNADCLAAMRTLHGVTVHTRRVSGSVAPRWRGALNYVALLGGLLATLLRREHRHTVVNLQFSIAWPAELPVLWLLRRRLVYTVHNAVPHGHAARQHAPTRWIARLARRLVFVSTATRDDFLQRYGAVYAAKSRVQPHGLLPVEPLGAPVPYRDDTLADGPEALVFWGTVQPYKGVDLFATLAADAAWRATGICLEVHGAWPAGLQPLREALRAAGVHIDDDYLSPPRLLALMARPVVFVLPYQAASQSGVLYTLLAQGCVFICSDVGDPGDFMRRHGLAPLLLQDRSAGAVHDALDRLRASRRDVLQALQRAQDDCRWETGAVTDLN